MTRNIEITASVTLTTEVCNACGITFAVPTDFIKKRRSDHGTFYCPSGHTLFFPAQSKEEKLAGELSRERQRKAQIEDELREEQARRTRAERQASAARGQTTRLRKRASAGVCPCCNRTFAALAQHMKTQHPTFKAEEVA